MGREFDLDIVAVVTKTDLAEMAGSIRELEAKGIVTESFDGRHRFAHDHLREIAYKQMLPARRRELHRLVGYALETHYDSTGSAEERSAELAYHFKEALENAKALPHLEEAAARAVATFANREAARLFRDLLEITAGASGPDADLRRARWERGLGDALHGEGQLDLSRVHLENALRLLGHSAPPPGARLALDVAGQLLEQTLRRVAPRRPLKVRTPEIARAQEAAQAYDRLLQIAYYSGAQAEMLHATLKNVEPLRARRPVAATRDGLRDCPRGGRGHPASTAGGGLP